MNVRKTASTTFSLVVLIVAVGIFLPMLLLRVLPYELMHFVGEWIYSRIHIGDYHAFMLDAAFWIVVSTGFLDAILRNRVAVSVFKSLNIPVVLSAIAFALALVPPLDIVLFRGLCYVIAIFGVYRMFRKLITNNRPGGQKLIAFIKGAAAKDIAGEGHVSDSYVVFGASLLLVVFWLFLLVSFAVYAATNWQVMF
jgi:hypothetical protein